MTWPRVAVSRVPWVSAAEMRQADSTARSDFGIEPIQLMEAAGIHVARLADDWRGGIAGKQVVVVAGGGNNGGDALVAARHLVQRGAIVQVWVVGPEDRLGDLTRQHLGTARRMGISLGQALPDRLADIELVVDGLLGTGVRLPLRRPALEVIATMNQLRRPILSIDVPSGLDSDTGAGQDQCVQAAATLTLGVPKPGLRDAPPVGRLFLADIGLPAALFGPQGDAVRALYRKGELLELVSDTDDAQPL